MAALANPACNTVTTETRSEPVLRGTTAAGQDWEVRGGNLFVDASPNPGHVVVRVVRKEQCFEKFEDTYGTTVTRVTVLGEKDKTTATSVASAGGVVMALGGLAGLALTPFVIYDTRAEDTAGNLVPVADQPGFALWPIGLSVTAVSILAGATALAAPVLAGESVVAEDETSTKQRREEKVDCTREVPASNEQLEAVADGRTMPLGATDGEGKATIDITSLIPTILPPSAPRPTTASIIASPTGAVASVAAQTGGEVDGVVLTLDVASVSTTTAATIPITELAEVATWNAESQKRLADERVRALAGPMKAACSGSSAYACLAALDSWADSKWRVGEQGEDATVAYEALDELCGEMPGLADAEGPEDAEDAGLRLSVKAACYGELVRLSAGTVRMCRESCRSAKGCACKAPTTKAWAAAGKKASRARAIVGNRADPKSLESASTLSAALERAAAAAQREQERRAAAEAAEEERKSRALVQKCAAESRAAAQKCAVEVAEEVDGSGVGRSGPGRIDLGHAMYRFGRQDVRFTITVSAVQELITTANQIGQTRAMKATMIRVLKGCETEMARQCLNQKDDGQ